MKKEILPFIIAGTVLLLIGGGAFLILNKDQGGEDSVLSQSSSQKTTRTPAVAGSFYPGGKAELEQTVEGFLENVSPVERQGDLKILIAPHAGYSYSGQVAAYGFKEIKGQSYQTVLIIGNSHQQAFDGAALPDHDYFQTPLGSVEIDWDLGKKLLGSSDQFFKSREIHQNEHSLEIEIPFLQQTLESFKILPILLGTDSSVSAQEVAETIYQNLPANSFIVISSDLAHYPDYQGAQKSDQATIEAILTGSVEELDQTIQEIESENIPDLATCACGAGAVKTGMYLAQKMGLKEIELLDSVNSGDISLDKSRVVGYASVGFYSDRKGDELNKEEQEELLKIARQTLESYLETKKIPVFEIQHPFLENKLGAFVTLRKEGKLRGCIGRFEPDKPLWRVVQEMAIAAATQDTRFFPVSKTELSSIDIEISVLSPLRRVSSSDEVEIGKHGVSIKRGTKGGVFLPQVATENNWDKETFLSQLCANKAGLSGDCWKDPQTELYVFTAQVFEEEERQKTEH